MSGIEKQLYFIEVDQVFRQMGGVPRWATLEGYNPRINRQVAVFGDRSALKQWRQEKGLDEKKYPIHDARLGTHIDVYGEKMISALISEGVIIDMLWYFQEVFKGGNEEK